MTDTLPAQPPESGRYRPPAIALHWLIALLIFAGYALGLFMHDLPASADKLRYYSWHKWMGVTVFLLAIARAAWRATHRPPALTSGSALEHLAAHAAHALLYVLMFAIPLSGWLHSSASGYQTVYLGLLPLPDLLAKNAELAKTLGAVHGWLNYLLIAVLIGHAGAALLHQLVRRDGVLGRMLPRGAAWANLAMLATLVAFSTVALLFAGESSPTKTVAGSADEAAAPAATSGELSAEFRQMNVPVTGNFTRFSAESLSFDPAAPQDAKAEFVVETASFDIGDPDYNAEVRKPEWFDSSQHPQARFVSGSVRKIDDTHFEASGELSIKGKTNPVTVTFTTAEENGSRVFTGEARLSRAAYAIGDDEWNDVLDDAVIVRFRIAVPQS